MGDLNKKLTTKVKKMPDNIIEIVDQFVAKVRETLGKRMNKIILYGSYARRRL